MSIRQIVLEAIHDSMPNEGDDYTEIASKISEATDAAVADIRAAMVRLVVGQQWAVAIATGAQEYGEGVEWVRAAYDDVNEHLDLPRADDVVAAFLGEP